MFIRFYIISDTGRSLHGERGLKSYVSAFDKFVYLSLPSRGAWIEINVIPVLSETPVRRSLHGERGLKYLFLQYHFINFWSLPSRGAWIEIIKLVEIR